MDEDGVHISHAAQASREVLATLGNPQGLRRTVALVGLMGAGKSSVGRRVAAALNVPFMDADDEIVVAAGRPIADIFAERGEEEFRAGERRVIARLLNGPPCILATGGGAFMNPLTRVTMRQRAVSLLLKADLNTLMGRVSRRDGRPLLQVDDPRAVMQKLMDARYPIYAEADLVVESRPGPHHNTVEAVLRALHAHGVLGDGELDNGGDGVDAQIAAKDDTE